MLLKAFDMEVYVSKLCRIQNLAQTLLLLFKAPRQDLCVCICLFFHRFGISHGNAVIKDAEPFCLTSSSSNIPDATAPPSNTLS